MLFLTAVLACYGSIKAQNDSTNALPAKVYFIRATGFGGSMVKFRAWVNGEVICRLGNNHYSVHNIKPGNYTFHATSFDKYKMNENGFEMQVEAGKTYYLRMVIKKRAFESYIYIQEITENSATPLLEKCKEEDDCGG